MKKSLSLLASLVLVLASCVNGVDDNSTHPSKSDDGINVSSSELARSAWFSGDAEICFPYENETLYINYMPDSINTEKWISLTENPDGTFTAKIEWSENIREIGKTSTTQITKKGSTLSVKSDFFNYSSMTSYKGVTASSFDPDKVPALKAEYLSNFSGEYTLNAKNYKLSVGAKLGMSKDVNHYWNANVLNAIVRDDGAYDMLLAHSSAKNGSGSIDPGITGKEPFISKQGLFWSHLILTQEPGSKWNINWSSTWYDSPYEALNAQLDMTDSFTGPATTKITYKYNFYFGNPKPGEDGWYTVDKGEKIGLYTTESDLPLNMTWKEILESAKISPIIPEGKTKDYWWYSTNSITSIENSYVYKLDDTTKPSLYEYDFYLALKNKAASGSTRIFIPEGTYTPSGDLWVGYSLSVEGNTCTLVYPNGSKIFDVIHDFDNNTNYEDFGGDYPNIRIFYKVTGKYRVKLYKTAKSGTTLVEWPK